MLRVKGSVPASIRNYVKQNSPQRYQEWCNRLSRESKTLFSGAINVGEWIDAEIGVINPTTIAAEMFFGKNNKKAAWETGRYSAQTALTGIYKVFVMVASPKYMIDRASKILVTFYDPSVMEVVDLRPKGVTLHITHFPNRNPILEYRIGGWIEKALEICGCKDLSVKITRSMSSGDILTEYKIDWS
jgi:hypothetical protein